MEEVHEAISLVKTEKSRPPSAAVSSNDDVKYYNDILSFLTYGHHNLAGTSGGQQGNFDAFEKEAHSFRVIGGVLYKGARNPKRVITDAHERLGILAHFHVEHSSGIHKSIEETIGDVQQQFFWKAIAIDTKEFVRNCSDCNRQITSKSNLSPAWSQLELVTHGPFNADEDTSPTLHVITLTDLASKYVLAKCVSIDQDLAEELSKFLFASLCQFGFAQCTHVCTDESLHQSFLHHFEHLLQHLPDRSSSHEFIARSSIPSEFNHFLTESLSLFISSNTRWPHLLDVWLFKQRTSRRSFLALFNREPSFFSSQETKKKRRPLKSCVLQCRHCGQVFTSKVSFKLHQNRHLQEARQEGAAEYDQALGTATAVPEDEETDDAEDLIDQHQEEDVLLADPQKVSNAVAAVQVLMSETKEERSKRGKYFKYSPELKEEIAEYAEKHGSLEASNHYSKTLGNPLSESTIRNFVKNHLIFSAQTKEEIGQYAYQFGLEACLKMYSAKLPSLNRPIIKRFKDLFVHNHPDWPLEPEGAEEDMDDSADDEIQPKSVQKFVFDPSLKTEIGRYALHCGNANAVLHFSKKLRFPITISSVRMFKKAFAEKYHPDDTAEPTTHKDGNDDSSIPLPLTVSHRNPKVRLKRRTKPKKIKATQPHNSRSKRGTYSTYSPQLRAQIATYASNHGNQETIQYFKETLDIEVPESTVRGLRDKFLRQKKNSEEMNSGPRGRPKRLGKYDGIVQKCIREIVESGEKPTAFLAIAMAKQVLVENGGQKLLSENGGHIELNTTWAKSFLRRMQLGT